MKSSVKNASLLTRNHQRKNSLYRPWNRNWNMSDSWRMEPTARPTHQIDRKNRFIANAWKCQTHYATADPEIISENWVPVEWEINFENWVMGWQMELTANNNSRFTYEINRENRFIIDAWNRLCKLRHYWPEIVSENIVAVALKSQLKSKWQLMYGVDSTTYASNR